MYDEFQSNPRSRFFFSNINLPLVKKHHQWIVLNRQHAARLADHPEKWCCGSWMVHHYPHWHVIGNFAASDEYLPFYAIGDLVGIDTIMLEVNAGQAQDLRVFNNTYQVCLCDDYEIDDHEIDETGGDGGLSLGPWKS